MKRMEKPPVVDVTPSFALESIEDLRAQAVHEDRWIWDGYERTPRRALIELNADSTDYLLHGDFVADEFDQGWPVLLGVLEDATHKLSRRKILEQWPEDYPKPAPNTLWRWLDRAAKNGLLLQEGTGRRYHPFVYWLKVNEEKWANDPWQLPPLPGWNEQ